MMFVKVDEILKKERILGNGIDKPDRRSMH